VIREEEEEEGEEEEEKESTRHTDDDASEVIRTLYHLSPHQVKRSMLCIFTPESSSRIGRNGKSTIGKEEDKIRR
jgi:hypothetical protein